MPSSTLSKVSQPSLGVQIFLGPFPIVTFSCSHLISVSEGIWWQECGLFPGPAVRAWEHFQALLIHWCGGPTPTVLLMVSCAETEEWRLSSAPPFSGPPGKGEGGCCDKGKKRAMGRAPHVIASSFFCVSIILFHIHTEADNLIAVSHSVRCLD